MKAFRIKESLQLLHDACRGVCNTVFVSTRPKELRGAHGGVHCREPAGTDKEPDGGAVRYYGDDLPDSHLCSGQGRSEDISRIDELADKVVSLFPISRGGICASDPQVVLEGSDGNGFHVALIQSALKTY